MNTAILKNVLRLFEEFGCITARSMFGGFGIFNDGTIFALVIKDVLHIRATSQTIDYFTSMGFRPYTYKKNGFETVTQYFALPRVLWEDTVEITSIASVAFKYAKIEEQAYSAEEAQNDLRIKDLPNLSSSSENMLKQVGIQSVQQLQSIGAAKAYKEVQKIHANTICHNFLWSLEGAIHGMHWSGVTKQRQKELMYEVSHSNIPN